jgi:hypothetical protein
LTNQNLPDEEKKRWEWHHSELVLEEEGKVENWLDNVDKVIVPDVLWRRSRKLIKVLWNKIVLEIIVKRFVFNFKGEFGKGRFFFGPSPYLLLGIVDCFWGYECLGCAW